MIGSTVAQYRLLGPFGAGGGLYRAETAADHRPALLLVIVPERTDPEAVERFRRAALAASALDHPGVATVVELGSCEDGRLFAALAPVEGETLEDRLARGALPAAEALACALALADGLGAALAEGIVHGDLRPGLVLLTHGGPCIAAFGLGEVAAAGPTAEEGASVYRAPERLAGGPPGSRADVWSLGVLLYEMVAGRPPFRGADESERAAAVAEAPPDPLPAPLRGIEGVLLRALRKRPEERWRNVVAMAAALRNLPSAASVGSELAPTLVDFPAQPGGSARSGSGPITTDLPGGSIAMAGRDVESYRLGERLGSGGMAVVFRAEDLRLGRPVALKFLAPELCRDPAAKQRFLREARAASALDHPNLCTIHEVGETADGQIFLAMPCYEGETLRQRIRRGPLSLDDAVDIASQVAQGLGKAHRNGIVHRDIKPANLMITTDGVVKILDFGLAKLAGTTGTARETGGGTLAYMSPEQTRGDDVDGRADLWSLGVVLYEMLTGVKPFRADREQAVVYAIGNTPPEPLASLRPEVPAELERIVGLLLAKDPGDRYATAEALVADLRFLLSPTLTGVPAVLAAPPARRRRWRRRAMAAAGVAGLLVLTALLVGIVRGRSDRAAGSGPVEASFTPLTSEAGVETFPSLSPDGEFFVYARTSRGDLDIFWQRVGGGNPQNLTGDSPWPDTQPALSPDAERIAFRSEREGGGLFLMGATGESQRRLTSFGFNPSWSPDGSALVFATESINGPGSRATDSELWRVDVASPAPRRLETRGDAVQPSWSPGGHRIAYWSVRAGSAEREIWTLPAAGGEPVLAVSGQGAELIWCPVWSADGRSLYFASDKSGTMGLWRIRIDERTGRTRHEPQQILAPATWSALPSLARDGRIAFVRQQERANLVRVGLDPARLVPLGAARPVTRGSRSVSSVHVTPDGGWIVYGMALPQEDLFIARSDGSDQEQITNDPARDRLPRWSGSGRRAVFYSERGGDGYEAWAWTRDPARAGAELERLTALPEKVLEPIESPDGSLLVCSLDYRGPFLIDLRAPLDRRVPRPLPVSGGAVPAFAVTSWSPDSSRLAGFDEQGRIVVYSFATRQVDVLPERGTLPTWLHDDRTLLYLRDGAVWTLDTATRQARPVLAPPPDSTFSWLAATPDGRWLYLVHRMEEADLGMLTLE